MKKKILSLTLAILMIATLVPAFSGFAATHGEPITQASFSAAESSAYLSFTGSMSFDGKTVALIKPVAGAFGSLTVEGWSQMPKNIKIGKYKYAKITYFYTYADMGNGEGTGDAVGKKMTWGVLGSGNGTASGNFSTINFGSRDTIVADEWATCTVDFSALENNSTYTTFLSGKPGYDIIHQVKYQFYGSGNVATEDVNTLTVNENDKMYIEKIVYYTADPDVYPSGIPNTQIEISYAPGEGTGTTLPVSANCGSNITFPNKPVDFANGEKLFAGWSYNDKVYAPGATTKLYDDANVTISALWSSGVTYASADGVITGVTDTVHTTLAAAVTALGSAGGTIYVEGELSVSASTAYTNVNPITIKGYNNVAANGILTTSAKGINMGFDGGSWTFDNITIKPNGADETSIRTNNSTVTFGPGCAYAQGTVGTQAIWLGSMNSSLGGQNFVLNSPNLKYQVIGAVHGWGASATISGHSTFVINAANSVGAIFGTSRDGNVSSGGVTIRGDMTTTINGGTISNIFTTGENGKGKRYGNVIYIINGGNISNPYFGGNQTGTSSTGSYVGNQAYIVNLKEFKAANQDPNGFTIADKNLSETQGSKIVVLNNIETVGHGVTVTASLTGTANYSINVLEGKAIPVFAASSTSSGTSYGALKGFRFTNDVAANTKIVVNGDELTSANLANGETDVYVLNTAKGPVYNISFVNPNAASATVTFNANGATGTMADGKAFVDQDYVYPACTFTRAGFLFAGWLDSRDSVIRAAGAIVPQTDTTAFTLTAQWVDSTILDTIYIDGVNGNDTLFGESETTAVKTLARAFALTKAYGANDGGTIIVSGNLSVVGGRLGAGITNRVTIQGSDGTKELFQGNDQIFLECDVTFKDLTIRGYSNKHINVMNSNVIFDTGITVPDATGSYIFPNFHLGPMSEYSGSAVTNNATLTIKSGRFTTVYLGGYLNDTIKKATGNITVNVEGGNVAGITVSADTYNDGHKALEIGGNLTINVTGGTVGSITSRNDRLGTIDGATNIIYKEGTVGSFGSTLYAELLTKTTGKAMIISVPDTATLALNAGQYTFNNATFPRIALTEKVSNAFTYINTNEAYDLAEGVYYAALTNQAVEGDGSIIVDYTTPGSAPVPPAAPAGQMFIGFYNTTAGSYIEDGDTIAAGDAVTAKYVDIDTNFLYEGAQIRITGEPGMRFILKMNTTLFRNILAQIDPSIVPGDPADTGIGYGTVLLPTSLVTGGNVANLTKQAANVVIVPAVNVWKNNANDIEFTTVLTKIDTKAKMEREIMARGYCTYKDFTGVEHTIYTSTAATKFGKDSLLTLANKIITAGTEDPTTLEWIQTNIVDVCQ